MPNAATQKYRLMIGAPHAGTLISIGAAHDDEALHKAERIFARISAPDAEFRLQRANGALIMARPPSAKSM